MCKCCERVDMQFASFAVGYCLHVYTCAHKPWWESLRPEMRECACMHWRGELTIAMISFALYQYTYICINIYIAIDTF